MMNAHTKKFWKIICIIVLFALLILFVNIQRLKHIVLEKDENFLIGEELTELNMVLLEKYKEVFAQTDARRTALIYLDDDPIPELLVLKDGEYHLYFFDGSEVNAVSLPEAEMKANAYGMRYSLERLEDTECQVYYWFEYAPCKGLIRIHRGDNGERHDYYLKYEDGLLMAELETSDDQDTWNTYDAAGEITFDWNK